MERGSQAAAEKLIRRPGVDHEIFEPAGRLQCGSVLAQHGTQARRRLDYNNVVLSEALVLQISSNWTTSQNTPFCHAPVWSAAPADRFLPPTRTGTGRPSPKSPQAGACHPRPSKTIELPRLQDSRVHGTHTLGAFVEKRCDKRSF